MDSGDMNAQDKQRYTLLDGLRGLAALGVILDHVPSGPLVHIFPGRYLGVQFFFVLSGFVMCHAYRERLASGMSAIELLRVRFIRLYPLYLLAFAIAAVLALAYAVAGWRHYHPHELATMIWFGALMLPTPFSRGGALYPLNGPSWSLFFELVVNFIYSLVARWLTPAVFVVMLTVSGSTYVWSCFAHTAATGAWQWSHFDMGLSGVIYDFFMGVLIYEISTRRRLPQPPAWLAFIVYLAILMVSLHGVQLQAWIAFVSIILMPLLVALFANSEVKGAFSKVCALSGALSYGVYILHVPIAGAITAITDKLKLPPGQGMGMYFLVASTALLAAAIADVCYDRPARKLLNRLFA